MLLQKAWIITAAMFGLPTLSIDYNRQNANIEFRWYLITYYKLSVPFQVHGGFNKGEWLLLEQYRPEYQVCLFNNELCLKRKICSETVEFVWIIILTINFKCSTLLVIIWILDNIQNIAISRDFRKIIK